MVDIKIKKDSIGQLSIRKRDREREIEIDK